MKTNNLVIILFTFIFGTLLGFYLGGNGVAPGPSALADKQYDKGYKIYSKSDYSNDLIEVAYSLPSECEILLKDLNSINEKTIVPTPNIKRHAKWMDYCGFYLEHKDKSKIIPHDFITSVDLYNLPLDEFPFPCGISGGIFNDESMRDCIDSISEGKVMIMDTLMLKANGEPWDKSLWDREGKFKDDIVVDKTTCRFINGEGPKGIYYDESEGKIYCGIPDEEKYMNHWNTNYVGLPPFSESFSFADYNSDGYMDAALTYAGRSCDGSGCGGAGVIILTKKSKEGKLERILFD